MDRILALHPERRQRGFCALSIEVYQRADTGPLRAAIEKILANEAWRQRKIHLWCGWRFILLCTIATSTRLIVLWRYFPSVCLENQTVHLL